jgi:Animal haem peroxidase
MTDTVSGKTGSEEAGGTGNAPSFPPSSADTPYRLGAFSRAYAAAARRVDHKIGWSRMPKVFGLLDLIGVRYRLRERNLHDTSRHEAVDPPTAPPFDPAFLTQRTPDGSWNDLANPTMGMAGSRFGRNVPIEETWRDEESLLDPSPRMLSRKLMTRHNLIAAEAGNAIIAAWLQFMIRDWFKHGESPTDQPYQVELEDDDDWGERPMPLFRTPDDPTAPASSDKPRTFVNTNTHWWDGSQVYGNNLEQQRFLRSGEGGKLRIEDGMPPIPYGEHSPARVPGFWLGIAMLTTVFAKEHNAICDELAAAHPEFDDEELFQKARLVNSALLAKIHTIEWTPAVTAHPTAVTGLHANWYGLAGRRLRSVFSKITSSEAIRGIPGTPTAHYGVPYSLTEEFVGVYRMHPLVPDDFDFRAAADDSATLGPRGFDTLTGEEALNIMREQELGDLLYTFGTMNPGMVVLHNFPKHLQNFKRPDGKMMDLAAVDIFRCRELGVPRYTEFRRLLNMTVPKKFSDITSNPTWARELEEAYGGDIDKVDLVPGLYAEDLPKGFAFSDTAFRIFVLMASRRLNSDRFFTTHFTPEVYTKEGLEWVDKTTMVDVLRRHAPELAPYLDGVTNAFALWKRPNG